MTLISIISYTPLSFSLSLSKKKDCQIDIMKAGSPGVRLADHTLFLFGLELLFPGLIQVNESFIVDNKENDVQDICSNANYAKVLQHKIQDVT